MVASLSTAGVSDEAAQELQMPMGSADAGRRARSSTLKDPGTPDQIVLEQHTSDTLSESTPCARCASNLEDVIHRTVNSRKSMQLYLNFSLIRGYIGRWEALYR